MIWFVCILMGLSHAELMLEQPKYRYEFIDQVKVGAKAFVQSCYSCHSMSYMRSDPISLDAGIDPEIAPVWDPESWMGHPPPDLSLVTAYRGVDYVYSYLRGYYLKAEGEYDNIVMPGTQMPNPFITMQGDQVLRHQDVSNQHLYEVLSLKSRGSMTPQEFEDYVVSIVAYLEYASDPSFAERYRLAPWVLGFLAVMILLMIHTDLIYWKNIHKEHQDDD
ncbi:hypothetical protein OAT84_00235 [Gammaproteobacteria bacterium]|nr:hypothetical protein [Gammaproteobacteria bacterium]